MVPVINPWMARSRTSSSAERTNAMRPSSTAPPNMARSTMSLRPQRSASAPQIGEAIIMVRAWLENTRPERTSVPSEVTEPRDFT